MTKEICQIFKYPMVLELTMYYEHFDQEKEKNSRLKIMLLHQNSLMCSSRDYDVKKYIVLVSKIYVT